LDVQTRCPPAWLRGPSRNSHGCALMAVQSSSRSRENHVQDPAGWFHGSLYQPWPQLPKYRRRGSGRIECFRGAGSLCDQLSDHERNRYGRALLRRCRPALRLQLGRAMVTIVGAIAELERNLIIDHVRAGMNGRDSKASKSIACRSTSISRNRSRPVVRRKSDQSCEEARSRATVCRLVKDPRPGSLATSSSTSSGGWHGVILVGLRHHEAVTFHVQSRQSGIPTYQRT
jgi:hypothetical protein